MPQPTWVQACVKAGQRYSFARRDRFVHNCVNLAVCACLLVVIVATVWSSGWVWHNDQTLIMPSNLKTLERALFVVGAIAVTGWCYFGILILVVHEASHGMFLLHDAVRTRRSLNHVSGMLACTPFGIDFVKHWEQGHLVHHRRPLEPDDPQRLNTRTGPEFWKLFWSLLVIPGFAFVERFLTRRNRARGVGRGYAMKLFLLFWVIVGTSTWHLVSPLGVLVELCGLQVLSALNQLKGTLEHGGTIGANPNPLLRSRTTLLPVRWLLMPFNISLHFEHHLNATVPWYSLPAYHRAIADVVPDTERTTFFSTSAFASLR
jgi:fatty acid desaturase